MATLELDGWGNGYAPPEEEMETPSYFSELEEQQEWNQELKSKIEKAKAIIDFCKNICGDNTLLLNKLNSIKL